MPTSQRIRSKRLCDLRKQSSWKSASHTHDTRKSKDESSGTSKEKEKVSEETRADRSTEPSLMRK
jgi:hypothetical protein